MQNHTSSGAVAKHTILGSSRLCKSSLLSSRCLPYSVKAFLAEHFQQVRAVVRRRRFCLSYERSYEPFGSDRRFRDRPECSGGQTKFEEGLTSDLMEATPQLVVWAVTPRNARRTCGRYPIILSLNVQFSSHSRDRYHTHFSSRTSSMPSYFTQKERMIVYKFISDC